MEFIIKKTTELNNQEKESLLDCFNEVFEQNRTMVEMYNQYRNTPMGYCVHSLCIDDGIIIAAHTAFPSYYWVGNQKVKAYITGDSMVKKAYRNGDVYLDIVSNVTHYMKKEGYLLSFGFPNEAAYLINKRGKLSQDVGLLSIYVLPYRIGGIKPNLRWLNPFSVVFCRLWFLCNRVGLNKTISRPLIHKDEISYNECRYKRMDGRYKHVSNAGSEFYYIIKDHEKVRTAFLIDVVGKSEVVFWSAIRHILKYEKKNFDLLMFVGHLPSTVNRFGLFKVPRRLEPKHFYMTAKVFNSSEIDKKVVFDIDNWDVNLSDYDLI